MTASWWPPGTDPAGRNRHHRPLRRTDGTLACLMVSLGRRASRQAARSLQVRSQNGVEPVGRASKHAITRNISASCRGALCTANRVIERAAARTIGAVNATSVDEHGYTRTTGLGGCSVSDEHRKGANASSIALVSFPRDALQVRGSTTPV